MNMKPKKIAITGHSKGIGHALTQTLKNDHTILGFSRSNGYDLSDKLNYLRAWEEMRNADVLINNAYTTKNRYLQTEILNDFMDLHLHDESKLIINLLSMAPHVFKSIPSFNQYAASKVLLADTVNRLKLSNHKCGIICVAPGWVETPMFHRFKDNYPAEISDGVLSAKDVAEKIVDLMKLFYETRINVYMLEFKLMR
jgi:short-subunit dehydrogenase